MKRILILISIIMAIVLVGCGDTSTTTTESGSDSNPEAESAEDATTTTESASDSSETITVEGLDANREATQVEVPSNPQRVVVIDMAALDTLDALGVGSTVVGLPKNTQVDYLESYTTNDALENVGSLKEPDLEAIMSLSPDLIIMGGRAQDFYGDLSKIAPTLFLSNDYEVGVLESATKNIHTLASIFGKEAEAKALTDSYQERLETLKPKAEGLTAVMGIVTNGGFNTLGDGSRGSFITKSVGFENLAADVDSTHGNESSLELLVELDPDYLFIIDRDSAIAAEGAKLAEEILDNELVHKTRAYQDGHIIYLNPAAWYLTEGGATAMDKILSDVEGAFK